MAVWDLNSNLDVLFLNVILAYYYAHTGLAIATSISAVTMKFCPVVPEICCGHVHVPKKERRRIITRGSGEPVSLT
jgi:hypothetical protein